MKGERERDDSDDDDGRLAEREKECFVRDRIHRERKSSTGGSCECHIVAETA